MNIVTNFRLKKSPLKIYLHVPKCGGTSFWHGMQKCYSPEISWWVVGPRIYKYAVEKGLNTVLNQPYIEGLCKKDWIADFVRASPRSWRRNVKFLYGHAVYYGIHELFDRDAEYYTILREPDKLIVSLYNYLCGLNDNRPFQLACRVFTDECQLRTFGDWIDEYPQAKNHMTWFLSQVFDGSYLFDHTKNASQSDVANVIKGLSMFEFIGSLSNYSDIATVNKVFGLDNLPICNSSKSFVYQCDIDKRLLGEVTKYDWEIYSRLV